jgi:hypothetical protein
MIDMSKKCINTYCGKKCGLGLGFLVALTGLPLSEYAATIALPIDKH